jgi:hypothetical protein
MSVGGDHARVCGGAVHAASPPRTGLQAKDGRVVLGARMSDDLELTAHLDELRDDLIAGKGLTSTPAELMSKVGNSLSYRTPWQGGRFRNRR